MSTPATNVVVYSHRPEVREAIITAIGRRPAPDLGRLHYTECSSVAEVISEVDAGRADLIILDGEAQPTGGMGVSRQLKNEIFRCPPILVLTGRPQDGWLAAWSLADHAVPHPLDPMALAHTVADALRAPSPATAG